jgi:hypothetical protein
MDNFSEKSINLFTNLLTKSGNNNKYLTEDGAPTK